MPQEFDPSILSRLKPVAAPRQRDGGIHRLTFRIRMQESSGRPLLSVDNIPADNALSDSDRRVISEMRRVSGASGSGFDIGWGGESVSVADIWENQYLLRMLGPNDKLLGPDGLDVEWSDDMAVPSLLLGVADGGDEITPRLEFEAAGARLASPVFLAEDLVIDGHVIYRTAPVGDNFPNIGALVKSFPRRLIEPYLSLFLSYFSNITPVYGNHPAVYTDSVEKAVPTIILEKVASDQALYLRVVQTLDSTSEELVPGVTLTRAVTVTDDGHMIVRGVENIDIDRYVADLDEMILRSSPDRAARKDVFREGNFFIIPAETASPFLINHLQEILQKFRLLGSEKLKEYKVTPAFPKLKLSLSSGIDFLEGDAEVEVGGDTFSLADLLEQFKRRRYIQLSDGNRAIVDEKYIGRLQRIFNNRDRQGHVRVSFFDLPEVEELINSKVNGKFAERARDVFEGFNRLKSLQPDGIKVNATLRQYQKDGVVWLEYLTRNNLGGCLADDMGLGKTLQTIALLTSLYPVAEAPTLVVMPRSLLFNWEQELARFAPQLSVATYYGPDRDLAKCLGNQVVLTTYAVARNDIEQLKDIKFECAILDESQNIKNVASQTAQAVMLLDARHRFALSGTPMENNLTEIYSLFRFLNPTMFGTLENFNATYTYPIQKNGDSEALQSLRRRIYPFLLRRVKKEVLTELPDRIEQTIYVEMSESQKKLYESRRLAFRQEIESTIRAQGVAKAQFVMFQALNELRRIASVPESMSDGRVASPKIDELMDSLASAVGNGHKCVVFFNYIAGLEIVGQRLGQLGIDFESMTGSTSAAQRKKIVGRFQSDPKCMVLLMTLKVGGVGLNLTAADTVYIFEPWWNKAAEEQAVNRLHRIGQKATVNAFSIITVGTIEEKIQQLQQQKTELFNQLISSDTASTKSLTEEDIDFILS